MLEMDSHEDSDALLLPIAGALRSSVALAERADKEEAGIEREWIIDDECHAIEELLGLAFVVAQVQITRVISHGKWLHKLHRNRTGNGSLLGVSDRKEDILAVATARIGAVGHTAVEGINSFANYFKHRDEWPSDWNGFTRDLEKRTAEVIKAFGAKPGCTGNFRQGFEAIVGDHQYEDVTRLGLLVSGWELSLKNAYEKELLSGGWLQKRASNQFISNTWANRRP